MDSYRDPTTGGSRPGDGEAISIVCSPDLADYATGILDAASVRCALCRTRPCACPPFGTPEYLALVDRLHEANRQAAEQRGNLQ